VRNSNISLITGKATDVPEVLSETTVAPSVYFCPDDDCIGEMLLWLDAAEDSAHCAIFEVGLEELREKLVELDKQIEVRLVTDSRYYKHVSDLSFARHDNRSSLMHNKFCVLDGKAVWTGSFNPTYRGNYKNNNNVVFYQSKLLAAAYEAEFAEMWDGVYGKGKRSDKTEFVINGNDVEVYFCPEDWCANKVIYALQDAEESIDFMTFSFTHDEIGRQLLERADAGVKVRGVFEKSQNNKYTEIYKLNDSDDDISVRWDGNGANMHHKVFVIDNRTVVTGSFNPSQSGDTRNDENLLIIHDADVAALYVAEFERVWREAD
jgi:phosphatidylserine/phosphatidylglycerophosphate/cardiolipin synthase-like enzyme